MSGMLDDGSDTSPIEQTPDPSRAWPGMYNDDYSSEEKSEEQRKKEQEMIDFWV